MSIIGYSQADFQTLIEEGKLYIDRTSYIQTMENQSNTNLIFVRPRRFGKSLWISILQYYYAIEHADKFDRLFGNTAIGKKPTPLRNSFMVMRFQFAGINVDTAASTFRGFRANVMTGVLNCMSAYREYFTEEERKIIEGLEAPENMIQRFFAWYAEKKIPHKIYILIDEYDQFANELVSFDTERFLSIVGRSGYVRKYYEMIKNAANEGIVARFFATGVSPLTVDSLTSGFNITSSLSLDIDFHNLMGFTRDEVIGVLKKVGAEDIDMPFIMHALKEWYDGYLFNEEAPERLFNSDMVMYFASHYENKKKFPRKMLDANIATDYYKVKMIFNIQQREQEFLPVLRQLTNEGYLMAEITDFYNLDRPISEDDLISLLFYMGWITIEDEDEGIYRFVMPNRVISELYYDYFVAIIEQETGFHNAAIKVRNALAELSKHNNPHPFLELIKGLIDGDLSMRDAQRFDEKHLKMLLIPFLSISAAHYVVSEPEWDNCYPDILLLKRPNITTQYNFIIELKYLKKGDENLKNPKTAPDYIRKIGDEAREQLTKYIQTPQAKRIENLKAWVWVLVGREWQIVEEVLVN